METTARLARPVQGKAHTVVWGGPKWCLPSPLPAPSSPLLKGLDRSPGPGLTPSPQPSCSCGLSKPGAAKVLNRCLWVSQGEEARCAMQGWARVGNWAGRPGPSPPWPPCTCYIWSHMPLGTTLTLLLGSVPPPLPRAQKGQELGACLSAPSTGQLWAAGWPLLGLG